MRLLKTLYVDTHGSRVSVKGRAIEVRVDGSLVARYPMAAIDTVLLTGRAAVTMETLARCQSEGISVASLRRGGSLRFTVGGPVNGNVMLRVAQIRLADDPKASLRLAVSFVAGKLQNQLRMMRRWAWDAEGPIRAHIEEQVSIVAERLAGVSAAPTGDHLRGLEGDASRRYFKAVRAHLGSQTGVLRFPERSRRPPRDPANALVSYVYGLVLAQVGGALDAVGLDPQVGYLHGLRPGRPSLGLDLLEELRPSVADRFSITLLARHQVSEADFVATPGGAVYLSDDGRHRVLDLFDHFREEPVTHPLLGREVARGALPTIQATLLARRIRGDLDVYPPYVMVT